MKKGTAIAIFLTLGAMLATYKQWHHASVLIFISILILSFFLAYKITDYITDFNTVKKQSGIDIIFLLIFCILLCIPASNISQGKRAAGENRYLAKKAVFIKNSKLNLNYGKEFNEWFNDRFNMRAEAIRTDMIIKCIINRRSCKLGETTFDKKYNLLYRNFNFWGMDPINENKEDILKTYVSNLNKLENYCHKNNIVLYLLIVPRACDYFDFDIPDKRKYTTNPADEVIDYIRNNTKITVVYPQKAMAEANKITPVYFKTDHHWTKKGAYTGYSELIKEIQKKYPDIKMLDENKLDKYYDKRVSEWWDRKLNFGQTFKQMKLPKFYAKKILDTPYLYYKNPEFSNLKTMKTEYIKSSHDVQFYYQYGALQRLLVIGDSFGCNLFEFIPYSFQNSLYLYNNPRGLIFEKYKPIIEKYKPDILVLHFCTPNIPKILDLFPNKYFQGNTSP